MGMNPFINFASFSELIPQHLLNGKNSSGIVGVYFGDGAQWESKRVNWSVESFKTYGAAGGKSMIAREMYKCTGMSLFP